MDDSFTLECGRLNDCEESDICNMSWSETNDYSSKTSFDAGESNDSCSTLKRRFMAESGYCSLTRQSSSQGFSGTDEEDYLAVEKENEFLDNEDFQKLITGKLIRPAEPEEEDFTTQRKKQKVFHQETFESNVKGALDKLDEDVDLIGDFSRPYILPTIQGKHQDLKSISPSTLFDLLSGKYNLQVNSFHLLDCRFPYEFRGGHIKGAENVYTKSQIDDLLLTAINGDSKENVSPRTILIFHCEFSSERGPKLARYLRGKDRESNVYPKLHFPEIYLLEGGYKEYYKQFSMTCIPQEYLPMLHPDYAEELKHFKAKSKSESNNSRCRSMRRTIKIRSSQF